MNINKRVKSILLLTISLLLCLSVAACAESGWDKDANLFQAGDVVATDAELEAGNPIFVITLANGGVLRGELYPDIAPESVGNFIALANSGFYDGKIFHRVIPGFVIQAGCPNENGTGGPGWHIKGEFTANGFENGLKHTYGVISMARSSLPDSAGSQFFIMVADTASLDGSYAAFGLVTSGMEFADEVAGAQRDANDKPMARQEIKSIRVETFGVEYPYDRL